MRGPLGCRTPSEEATQNMLRDEHTTMSMNRELTLVLVALAGLGIHSLDETLAFGAPSGPPWPLIIAINVLCITLAAAHPRLGSWRVIPAVLFALLGAFVVSTGVDGPPAAAAGARAGACRRDRHPLRGWRRAPAGQRRAPRAAGRGDPAQRGAAGVAGTALLAPGRRRVRKGPEMQAAQARPCRGARPDHGYSEQRLPEWSRS